MSEYDECDACHDIGAYPSRKLERMLCDECRRELEDGFIPKPQYDPLMLKAEEHLVARMRYGQRKIRS